MMMKGPFREALPLGELKVRLRLPTGSRARRTHLLVSGRTPKTEVSGGYVSVTVPGVEIHEVVAIDL